MKIKRTCHPQINEIINLYEQETQPFRKVHRMVDLFEAILKTHTSFIIGSYFKINNLSEDIKGLLAKGLTTPSLGMWQLFSREIINDLVIRDKLNKEQYELLHDLLDKNEKAKFKDMYNPQEDCFRLVPGLKSDDKVFLKGQVFKKNNYEFSPKLIVPNYYDEFIRWDKSLERDNKNIISFRNKLAHGATPSDEDCIKYINSFERVLVEFLDSNVFSETSIAVFSSNDKTETRTLENKYRNENFVTEELLEKILMLNENIREFEPYVVNKNGEAVNLFPILSNEIEASRKGELSLIFFNDLKRWDKFHVSYLHYPLAKHLKEKDIKDRFLSVINIEKWKSKISNEFEDRISSLTESFKGRQEEINKTMNYICTKDKGFLMLFGEPGIGKSALVAEISKQLNHKTKNNNVDLPKIHTIEYFIRRGTRYTDPEEFLLYINRKIEDRWGTKVPLGKDLREMHTNFSHRLRAVSQLFSYEKLVIIIDGLDEGITKGSIILQYLPMEAYRNIIFIYSSRSIDEANYFYMNLPIEFREKITLGKLGMEDIRAILYEVVDKYKLNDKAEYVELIAEKSEGNPLYMTLLCQSIEENSMELDIETINNLPQKIDEFYEQFIYKYSRLENGDKVLKALYTIASAKEYVSPMFLKLVLQIDDANAEIIMSILKEVLYESNKKNSYQLFHESFREYLKNERSEEIGRAQGLILKFCRDWRQYVEGRIYSDKIKSYPMKYYAEHLLELGIKDELFRLIEDKEYLKTQFRLTDRFLYSSKLYEEAINAAEEEEDWEKVIGLLKTRKDLEDEWGSYEEDLIACIKAGGKQNILKALDRAAYLADKHKFILYMNMLYYLLKDESYKESERFELAALIINHLGEHVNEGFNWEETYPVSLGLEILWGIHCLGVDIQAASSKLHLYERKIYGSQAAEFMDQEITRFIKDIRFLLKFDFDILMLRKISNTLRKYGYCNEAKVIDEAALQKMKNQVQSQDAFENIKAVGFHLCEAGQVEEILRVVEILCDEISINGNDRDKFLRDMVIKLLELGNESYAMKVAEISKLDTMGYYVLGKISAYYFKQGNIEKALKVARNTVLSHGATYEAEEDKCKALQEICVNLVVLQRTEEALRFINEIKIPEFRLNAMLECSDELYKQANKEQADNLLKRVLDSIKVFKLAQERDDYFEADVGELLKLVNNLDKIHNREEAKIVFDFTIHIVLKSRWKVKGHHIEKILNRLFDEHRIEEYLLLIDAVLLDEYIDAKTFTAVIDALIKLNLIDKSIDAIKKKNAFQRQEPIVKVAEILCRQEKLEVAAELIRLDPYFEVEDIGIRLAINGEVNKAIQLSELVYEREIEKVRYISKVSRRLMEQKQIEKALLVAEELKQDFSRDDLIIRATGEFIKRGFVQKGVKLIENNPQLKRWPSGYDWLFTLNQLVSAGRSLLAIEILSETINALKNKRSNEHGKEELYKLESELFPLFSNKYGEFLYVAEALAKQGKMNKLIELKEDAIKEIVDSEYDISKADKLLNMLKILEELQLDDECKALSELLIPILEEKVNAEAFSQDLGSLSELYANLGLVEKALRWAIEPFQYDGRTIWLTSNQVNWIVTRLIKLGYIKEVLDLVERKMNYFQIDKEILDVVACEIAKFGNEDKALLIQNGIPGSKSIIEISYQLFKKGQVDEVMRLILNTKGLRESSRIISLINIQTLLKEESEKKTFDIIINTNFNAYIRENNENKRIEILTDIFIHLCKMGRFKDSLYYFNKISGLQDKRYALGGVFSWVNEEGTLDSYGELINIYFEFLKEYIPSIKYPSSMPLLPHKAVFIHIDQIMELIEAHMESIPEKDYLYEELLTSIEMYMSEFMENTPKYIAKVLLRLSEKRAYGRGFHAYDLYVRYLSNKEKHSSDMYRFDNIDEWIDMLEDEDDRDEIELWARKVKKNKMTIKEFEDNLKLKLNEIIQL